MLASLLLAAAPVVDIDGTFFVQGGIYVGLVLILTPLLFKPWLAALARRTEAIEGATKKAKALRADANELGARYDEKLAEARDKAHEVRSDARRDEETKQSEVVALARNSAQEKLEAARKKAAEEFRSRGGEVYQKP